MNIGPRRNSDGSIDGSIDEHEWQAQERALREERAGAIAAGDDPLLARYRQVARALRRPLPDALPADFARSVAQRVATAHAAPDMRLEQQLLRVLSLLLAVSAIAAMALYGGQWLRAFAALSSSLPIGSASAGLAFNWTLALAACLGLSWSFERLRRGLQHH
jgi:hypothetical protein